PPSLTLVSGPPPIPSLLSSILPRFTDSPSPILSIVRILLDWIDSFHHFTFGEPPLPQYSSKQQLNQTPWYLRPIYRKPPRATHRCKRVKAKNHPVKSSISRTSRLQVEYSTFEHYLRNYPDFFIVDISESTSNQIQRFRLSLP